MFFFSKGHNKGQKKLVGFEGGGGLLPMAYSTIKIHLSILA